MSPLRSLHTLCLLIVGGLLLSFPLQMKAQYRLPLTPRSEEAPLRPADRSQGARLAVSTATSPLSVVHLRTKSFVWPSSLLGGFVPIPSLWSAP